MIDLVVKENINLCLICVVIRQTTNYVNREQLGQYWRCVVEDRDVFCPDKCDKCNVCKELSDVFSELQDFFFIFFYPRTDAANSQEEIPYQLILWIIFTSIINKNDKRFRIEIFQIEVWF